MNLKGRNKNESEPHIIAPRRDARISDELWALLQLRLSVHMNTHRLEEDAHAYPIATVPMPFSTCCARVGSRQALDQTELCAHSTAHDRFQKWVKAGVFLMLWQAGIEQFDELCGLDWQWLSLDEAMRHLRRWAEKKPAPIPPIGARAGSNAACSTYGHGVPIGLTIEGANRHDMKLVQPTIESIIVDRLKPA